MKKLFLAIIIIIALGLVFFLTKKANDDKVREPKQTSNGMVSFSNPKKSAHYESNTPEHGSILPGVPVNVVINFNFDLVPNSSITTIKDGKDYGIGEVLIDANKLAMRRKMNPASPDGVYRVEYKACWPDGSCHDGHFQFAIDRKLAESARDLRGKSEMNIDLAQIAFVPQTVRISKGTKVTWKNSDAIGHYVNTDSHPAHTYYPAQNSQLLEKGQTYSLAFDTPGVYPYHCSAHAENMTGLIIVE